MNQAMYFRVEGCFKPYVRMTQKGKWVKPDAQEYLSSQHRIAHGLKAIMAENGWTMIPKGKSLSVTLGIHHSHGVHGRDLDNETKAIIDSAQGIVFANDQWIDQITTFRQRGSECYFILYVHDWEEDAE